MPDEEVFCQLRGHKWQTAPTGEGPTGEEFYKKAGGLVCRVCNTTLSAHILTGIGKHPFKDNVAYVESLVRQAWEKWFIAGMQP